MTSTSTATTLMLYRFNGRTRWGLINFSPRLTKCIHLNTAYRLSPTDGSLKAGNLRYLFSVTAFMCILALSSPFVKGFGEYFLFSFFLSRTVLFLKEKQAKELFNYAHLLIGVIEKNLFIFFEKRRRNTKYALLYYSLISSRDRRPRLSVIRHPYQRGLHHCGRFVNRPYIFNFCRGRRPRRPVKNNAPSRLYSSEHWNSII